MVMMPEPSLVNGPSSAMPSAKMVGYMMELARPQRTRLQTATVPVVNMAASNISATPKKPRRQQFMRLICFMRTCRQSGRS